MVQQKTPSSSSLHSLEDNRTNTFQESVTDYNQNQSAETKKAYNAQAIEKEAQSQFNHITLDHSIDLEVITNFLMHLIGTFTISA